MLVFCYENKIVYNLIQALQLFSLAFFTKKKIRIRASKERKKHPNFESGFRGSICGMLYIQILPVPECEYYST